MELCLVLLVSTLVTLGGATVKLREEAPGLAAKAKVSPAAAATGAQAKVAGGRLIGAEIEEENGKLIYSFEFKTKGKSGIDEVTVDATTGVVLTVEHESPKDESREKAHEARTRRRDAK